MIDLPSTVRFRLFNDPDDAWAGGVAAWIREASERSLTGRRAWIVCGSYVQGNWLRYRCLQENILVYGIQFMDERRFRRELCRHYGLPTPAFGRETLLLLLRAHLDPAMADSAWPGQCLQALDELANTGWLAQHGLDAALDRLRVPNSARAIVERITESLLWRPRVDRELANCARVWPELDLLIYGPPYEALLAPELFSAGLKTAASGSIWVAQPFGSAELCFAAIERFEKEVGAAFEIAPASEGDRPFAAFAAEYNSEVEFPSVRPDLWMSRRWSEQVHLAAAIVRSRLQAGDERIAVVVPHDSPTGPAIVRTLQSNGVPTADEYRTPVSASRERAVQLWLAKQIEQDRQPEDLLALIERLVRAPQVYWNIRRFVFRRFEDIQTRDLDRLINRKTAPAWVVDLLALGNQWPERSTWEEFSKLWITELQRCQEILRSAGGDILPVTLSLEPLQPNWGEIGVTLRGLLIGRTLFCNYVRETLQDAPPEPQPGTGDRYSRVVVSTPARLAGTIWDTVVFLDQVGDAPVRSGFLSGLLDPSFRMEARAADFLFLQTGDNFTLAENLTLQILAGVRRHAALCWYQETDEGEEVDANFFVTTCQTLAGAEVRQVQIPERFELAPAEFDPMVKAYRNRRDSQQPFDAYAFCFGPEAQPQSWNVSRLTEVVQAPATFALRLVFDAERTWDDDLSRNERAVLGKLVHRALERILQPPSLSLGLPDAKRRWLRFGNEIPAREDLLARPADFARKAVDHYLPLKDDPWWDSVARKACGTVATMLREIAMLAETYPFCQAELSLGNSIAVGTEKLDLTGRIDVVLADRAKFPSCQVIIDFKTSSAPARVVSRTGEGFQLVGYRLLMPNPRKGEVQTRVLTPEWAKILPLHINEPELQSKLSELGWRQRERCFGSQPFYDLEFGISERLPIATVRIPPVTAALKATLTFPNDET